jgi:hypothetical protein
MANKVWDYSETAYVIYEHLAKKDEEVKIALAGKTEGENQNRGVMLWKNMNHPYSQSAEGYSDNGSAFNGLFDYDTNVTMPKNSLVGYMESHDEERTSFNAKEHGTPGENGIKEVEANRMKQAANNAAFFLTVPGPKMIWQFGELGYDISINDGGRTGKKPVKWDYYDNADRKRLYDVYSKLLSLRATYPMLFNVHDDPNFQWYVGEANWATGRRLYTRAQDDSGKKMVIMANFSGVEQTYSGPGGGDSEAALRNAYFPDNGIWYEYLSNQPYTVSGNTIAGGVTIPAYEFRLFLNFAPDKYIYTSDLGTGIVPYMNTLLSDETVSTKAGGWSEDNVSKLNEFLKAKETAENKPEKIVLDMSKADMESISATTNISGLLDGCTTVTSLLLPEGDYTNISSPTTGTNCFTYLPSGSTANTSWFNTIMGGQAVTDISINDTGLFHLDNTFTVPSGLTTTYTKNMKGAPKDGGWYAISLPFAPTKIVAKNPQTGAAIVNENGISPVTATDDGDFWLRKYIGSSGENTISFASVREFEANTPYIIAVPSSYWGTIYPNLWTVNFSTNAEVTFNPNAEMKTTDDDDDGNKYTFRGTMHLLTDNATDPKYYVLDFDANNFMKKEGGEIIKHFEAYFTDESASTSNNEVLSIGPKPVKEPEPEIIKPETEELQFKIYGTKGAVIVRTPEKLDISIYALNGRCMLRRTVEAGEESIPMPAGIYIVNNEKVLIY